MNPARLRALIRRYGEFGVLLVACYLGLHHLWTKRRLMLVTCILSTMLAGMLLWSQPQSAPIYPDFTQRMQPVSPPVTGQCDCSSETYQEEPAPAPFSPFAPLDIKVSSSRMPQGRYAVTMRDANGTEFQVRIFSAHEKVEIDNDAGSEFGGSGEKYHTGSYQIALRRIGARKHIVERIPLFGAEDYVPTSEGVFTPWNRRVFVRKNKARHWPDVLLITQYASSNGDYVRAFFIEHSMLVPVDWHISKGQVKIAQFVNGGWPLTYLRRNIYQTNFFNNGGDEYGMHTRIWRFEPKLRRFYLLREEKPNYHNRE